MIREMAEEIRKWFREWRWRNTATGDVGLQQTGPRPTDGLWAVARLILPAWGWRSLLSPRLVQCWAGVFSYSGGATVKVEGRSALLDNSTKPMRVELAEFPNRDGSSF